MVRCLIMVHHPLAACFRTPLAKSCTSSPIGWSDDDAACLPWGSKTDVGCYYQGDSLHVINAVLDKGHCAWEIDLIIIDIWCLLAHFRDVKVCHSFRDANSVGDKIAALHHDHPTDVLATHPSVCNLGCKDALGWCTRCFCPPQNLFLIKKK